VQGWFAHKGRDLACFQVFPACVGVICTVKILAVVFLLAAIAFQFLQFPKS
jgi:hypothetical protein